MRTQLIQEVFTALRTGESARAVPHLERLRDMVPEESFYALALARELERDAVGQVNALLALGRFEAATAYLTKHATTEGRASGALGEAEAVCAALQALREVAARCPFRDSESAVAAMARLEPHESVLMRCAAFRAWRQRQQQALDGLRQQERAVSRRQLLAALDLAVVGDLSSSPLLAAQVRELDEQHPVSRLLALAAGGAWTAFAEAVEAADQPEGAYQAAEICACLYWPELPADCKRRISRHCTGSAPASLSGLLLRALLAAQQHDPGAVATWVCPLADAADIGSVYVAELLEQTAPADRQFRAPCWRSPVPSVPDLLKQFARIRAGLRKEPE